MFGSSDSFSRAPALRRLLLIGALSFVTSVVRAQAPVVSTITPARASVEGSVSFQILGSGFDPDASVSIGSIPVIDFTVESDLSIVGIVPAGAQVGDFDVTLQQASGVATLNTGFRYTADELRHDSANVPATGSPFVVETRLTHEFGLLGYSFGVQFRDDTVPASEDLEIVEVDVVGTEAEDAALYLVQLDNVEGYWTIGVVMSISLPFLPIPPGSDQLAAVATYRYDGVDSFVSPVEIRGDLAEPPVAVLFVEEGAESIEPAHRTPATISFDGSAEFTRGDCNADAGLDIADAVSALLQLFTIGTIPVVCPRACDANDDGVFDIADAVFTLSFLFVPGSEPPPIPFPTCGAEATPDALACPSFAGCP